MVSFGTSVLLLITPSFTMTSSSHHPTNPSRIYTPKYTNTSNKHHIPQSITPAPTYQDHRNCEPPRRSGIHTSTRITDDRSSSPASISASPKELTTTPQPERSRDLVLSGPV